MGSLSFRGCFINLDQNQQRLALMTRQLADAGLAEELTRELKLCAHVGSVRVATNLPD